MFSRKSISIREVPQAAGPLAAFLQDVKRAIGVLADNSALVPDLEDAGVVKVTGGGRIVAGSGGTPAPAPSTGDITPPAPSGVSWDAALTNVIVSFGGTAYTGHAYAEVLRGATNDYSAAQVVARGYNGVAVDAIGPNRQAYYWLRFVSTTGTVGAPDTETGTLLKTGSNVTELLDALTSAAQNPSSPYTTYAVRAGLFYVTDSTTGTNAPVFAVVTSPTTVNGVAVPAGVYMADAFIKNGSIANAKIGNLAVDDAKIASVSVSKLTAGSIAVGQYIQSSNYIPGSQGFRVNADGTAEFSNATVRGTIYASAGLIAGITIASNYIASSNWNGVYGPSGAGWAATADGNFYVNNLNARGQINAGAFTGYAWPASGQTGAHLSSAGLLLGNANDGKYLRVDANGDLYAPQFSIINGVATFAGALSAASGSFSGSLNAAGGTFSGSLTAQVVQTANIVGSAVTSSTTATAALGMGTVSLGVTAPAGSSSIVVLLYQGLGSSAGETPTTPASMTLSVNGTSVDSFQTMGMYVINNPSGSYTITATNCLRLAALLTKR